MSATRRVVVGGGLAVVALAVLFAGASLVLNGSVPYSLLGLSGAASLLVLLAVPILKTDYDVVEPLSLVLLATAVGITLKPAYLQYGPEPVQDFLLLNRVEPSFLISASVLVLFGLMAFAAGYLLQVPTPTLRRFPALREESWSRWRVLTVALIALGVAALAMYFYLSKLGLLGAIEDFSRKRYYTVEGAEFERSALGYYRWGASVTGPVFLFVLAWALGRRARVA